LDDGAKVTFIKSGTQTDEHTGKPVPDALCFDYRDGDRRCVLTYSRRHTLVSQKLLDLATGWQKLAGEIIRYPGGYLRFAGPVSLDCYQGGEVVGHNEETGFFEQCYFARHIHDEQ
jgi:hypothetical protein